MAGSGAAGPARVRWHGHAMAWPVVCGAATGAWVAVQFSGPGLGSTLWAAAVGAGVSLPVGGVLGAVAIGAGHAVLHFADPATSPTRVRGVFATATGLAIFLFACLALAVMGMPGGVLWVAPVLGGIAVAASAAYFPAGREDPVDTPRIDDTITAVNIRSFVRTSGEKWLGTMVLVFLVAMVGPTRIGAVASEASGGNWAMLGVWVVAVIGFTLMTVRGWRATESTHDEAAAQTATVEVPSSDAQAAVDSTSNRTDAVRELRRQHPGLGFKRAVDLIDQARREP